MTTKFISLVTGIVLLDVFLQSQLSSNVPLFLFASSNLAVNIGLIVMVGLMVRLSFLTRFSRWQSFLACAVAGILLGAIGVLGTFFTETLYWFPSFFMPLDYMFMIEAGVVFTICALTYQHEALPFKFRLPNVSPILNQFKLVFPVPKLPHSPTSSRTRRTQPA